MNPTIIIIRGVSSVGKSTFAEYIRSIYGVPWGSVADRSIQICCADDEMMENGKYVFNVNKLLFAHNNCKAKFDKAIADNIDLIIVANTNQRYKDFEYYLENGKKASYTVHVMTLEKYHDGVNNHGVPLETLERQELNIKGSLKLR